ncbi:PREDICTED: AP-3 complex subunit delta-1 [Ceratosolen solmsi marchali]|uniref:AP-3 complex subunit delta n=1 Tax=Ceratosolen solmsi marchali TaxID=326594 RepID=A0AAJ6YRK8_9HYME|nr:PREDICTED: AP-3 complex subunit delta-1 [Ceratosolen solmsi marchali]
MALRKVKGNFERIFDKNLTDLVRGIRNNKENEIKYISQCMEEIKQELRQDNIAIKANAVAKLTYLQMLGYDISWAGFNIIEVMSSSKFTFKRIGYLAASQSFHMESELLMLTTNMIRKDLNSSNQYDAGLALNGLSCFVNQDLARDLVNDIMTLLTSTKPYLRKKAVLMMYKVFLQFPEALRPAFPRLKEKLEDPDSGVQSAAVNVVCELARKNPKNYLSLAPVFFKLMTTSTNNWMLIKIIKLFGALTPLEPRLGKKLIEPLTNLIHSTSAMSLLYECINTVIAVLISISSSLPNHSDSIQLCVQKLRILIEDTDQNLKYLGLLAMSKILKTHPKSVQAHKDLIMRCLDDKDESIRLRALDLLYGMVSKKNLMEIVKKLMIHMEKAEGTTYRDELLSKIIQICSQNNYQFITYFEWYISILVELTYMEGTKHGQLIATKLLDVAIRVQAIRKYAVQQCAILLDKACLLTGQPRATMSEVLYAAAWICGEFSSELEHPIETLQSMLKPQVSNLPGHIQAVYVHNILKLIAVILNKTNKTDIDPIQQIADIKCKLVEFVCSSDLEVQERSSSAVALLECLIENPNISKEISEAFGGELNPVAPKAQRKVPIPDDLDLDSWINDPPIESSDSENMDMIDIFVKTEKVKDNFNIIKLPELTVEELEMRRKARKLEQQNNPHYLKNSTTHKKMTFYNKSVNNNKYCENIPIAELNIPISLKVTDSFLSNKYFDINQIKKRKSRKNEKSSSSDDESYPVQLVNKGIGELPPGAALSDTDDNNTNDVNDPHRALNIDLDRPLREDERLPTVEHRLRDTPIICNVYDKTIHKSEKVYKKQRKKHCFKESKENKELKINQEVDLIKVDESEEEQGIKKLTVEGQNMNSKRSKRKKVKQNEDNSYKKIGEKSKKTKNKKTKNNKENQDYEETAGISTPSKEILPRKYLLMESNASNLLPKASKELAQDKTIQVFYEIKHLEYDANKIILLISFINKVESIVKELVFNVMDTPTLQLERRSKDEYGIKMTFLLLPLSSNEEHIAILVSDVTFPQKLYGTLTYIVQDFNYTIREKLDFILHLPCSSFMINLISHDDILSELLKSGQLLYKLRNQITICQEFSDALKNICNDCHLTLIEQMDKSTSLYGQSLKGHHVCLLFKQNLKTNTLIIEGKSDNRSLLSEIHNEIIQILT